MVKSGTLPHCLQSAVYLDPRLSLRLALAISYRVALNSSDPSASVFKILGLNGLCHCVGQLLGIQGQPVLHKPYLKKGGAWD